MKVKGLRLGSQHGVSFNEATVCFPPYYLALWYIHENTDLGFRTLMGEGSYLCKN